VKTLKFKTNINCQNCINKVSPALNAADMVDDWQVDTQNPDKILAVSLDEDEENANAEAIITLLAEKGYKAEVL